MEIGSLVCIINLLITPVGNVLMGWDEQRWILIGGDLLKPGNYLPESHTCA